MMLVDGGHPAAWVTRYPLTTAVVGPVARMSAAGRPGGLIAPSFTTRGRYRGRLIDGGTWDGGFHRLLGRQFRAVVDDFGAIQVVRRCCTCRRWRDRDAEFTPSRRDAGVVVAWGTQCRECKLARQRDEYAASKDSAAVKADRAKKYQRMMADPARAEARRARNRRTQRAYRARNAEAARASSRRWFERMKADPAGRAALNANAREGYRLRQQRAGLDVNLAAPIKVPSGARVDQGEFARLPVAPLAAVIEREMNKLAAGPYVKGAYIRITGDKGAPLPDPREASRDGGVPSVMQTVCTRAGVSDKTFREWRDGKRQTATFDLADRVISGFDLLWFDVFTPCRVGCESLPVGPVCADCHAYSAARAAFEGGLADAA